MGAIGIIMASLYKNSNTAEGFMRLPTRRILRIYLIIFIGTVLAGLISAYLSQRSFSLSGIPEQNIIQFQNYKSLFIFINNLGFFLLLIHANFYSFSQKKIVWVPYILACSVFILFCLKDSLFLEPYSDIYRREVLKEAVMPKAESARMWLKILMGISVTFTNALAVAWGISRK